MNKLWSSCINGLYMYTCSLRINLVYVTRIASCLHAHNIILHLELIQLPVSGILVEGNKYLLLLIPRTYYYYCSLLWIFVFTQQGTEGQ